MSIGLKPQLSWNWYFSRGVAACNALRQADVKSGTALSRRAAVNKMSGCAARNDLQIVGTFASVFIPINATMLSARSICPHISRRGGLHAGARACLVRAAMLCSVLFSSHGCEICHTGTRSRAK